MDIQSIVYRPDTEAVDVDEMVSVVKEHIKEVKGVDVDINIMKNLPPQNSFVFQAFYRKNIQELSMVYNISKVYFINKYKKHNDG